MNEKAIRAVLRTWLERSLGEQHVFTITFDADFVTGNLIDATFDAEAIDQVAFDTDQETTLEALAEAIRKTVKIFKVTVTGPRELTCVGAVRGDTIVVVGPTVTGGASQAVATVDDVQEAIFVRAVNGDQAAPSNLYPYATVRIDTIVKNGWDELRDLEPNTNIATYGGQRTATVSVEYYGQNPVQELMKAVNALERQTILDYFADNGIALQDRNEVQNLTRIMETEYEPRAAFDFFIGFADNYEDDLGIIEKVELEGDLEIGGTNVHVGPEIIGD